MDALEYFKAEAAKVIAAKQEAVRSGKNQVTYIDHEGCEHTLYYTSRRWVDAGTMARIRKQFPCMAK